MAVLRNVTLMVGAAVAGAVGGLATTAPSWLAAAATAATGAALVLSVLALRFSAMDRRTKTTLRETQERFRLIAETVTEVFWMADVRIDRMVYVSPGYERVYGRTCESLYDEPKSFIDAIHPDDRARVVAALGDHQRRSAPFDHHYRVVRPDRSIAWIWDRGFPVHNTLGETIHYVGVAQDVTERRIVEQTARDMAERFQLVSRATTDGIWDWDVVANTAWWSETFFATFGVDASTVPSYRAWVSLIHPDNRERVLASFEDTLEAGHDTWTCEYRLRHGDGTWCDVFDRAHVFRGDDGSPVRVVGATMDVSERRRLEHQLRHVQKMEAVGQHYAGGVAHDFNNIIQAILIQSQLLQAQHLPSNSATIVTDIRACADRAATLTRQLLLFGRREVMQLRAVDVNEVVSSLSTVLRRTLGEHISMTLSLADEPVIAFADRGMLDQVLLNLALNARDSMPNGGQLSIMTSVALIGTPLARQVCLTVRDTGTGIAPSVMPRIFEPFFTTKQDGEGSGLGLASTFGIVEQHRGSIEVDSTLDHGTTFRVFLPVGSGAVSQRREVPAIECRGKERILLVEDDDILRSTTRQILEQHGYEIVEASNGLEALDRWEQAGHVDLVLTDIVMPGGMNGAELVSRLEVLRPGLKIVFTSGYSAGAAGRDLHLGDHRAFVHKPVAPEHLLETVRSCLDC